jgi:NAD(P)-dependent dehydrogenase (short-subunit alcohol dehydrogenase family)
LTDQNNLPRFVTSSGFAEFIILFAEWIMTRIENKVAIITGSGGGIGGAIALRYAREGAKLAVADIDAATAKSRAAEINSMGCDTLAIIADVTDKKSVQRMVQTTLDRWGRIDILVNVAGGADRKPVLDITESDWDYIVNMNLKSVFLCSQAVLPTMLQQKYGKIVSISSIYGFTGNAIRSSYAAAKAGVAVFTKSLALEVVNDGINVNAIAPGRVATPKVRGRYSDEQWTEAMAQIPAGRAGTPDEIAGTALFLVLDESRYITGQTIHVNGAWLNW